MDEYFLSFPMKGMPCFICDKPIDGDHKILIKTKCSPNSPYYDVEEYICNTCWNEIVSRTKQVVR